MERLSEFERNKMVRGERMSTASISAFVMKAPMGTKDRGALSCKKVAANDLKQKRLDEKTKKDAFVSKPGKLV